ncbi:MAG: dihydrodipicolinate reductase, partial [Actinomycetota bacterium]|nr:dihydrodipicolinate reductase [Actinomycetota bacterium]
FEVQGLVDGHPLLVVEHITRIVDDTAKQWESAKGMGYHAVRISGTPNVSLTLESEDEHGDHVAGGNTTAAARITNAIPWVCDAPPGVMAAIDLPLIAGRGLVRPPEHA